MSQLRRTELMESQLGNLGSKSITGVGAVTPDVGVDITPHLLLGGSESALYWHYRLAIRYLRGAFFFLLVLFFFFSSLSFRDSSSASCRDRTV